MPAVATREIVISSAPESLPQSPPWLLGLAHWNSEFIPVVSLQRLLESSSSQARTSHPCQLLVIAGTPVWAIQVHEVVSIADVDATLAPQSPTTRHLGIVGTFALKDKLVRVLEPRHLLQRIGRSLNDQWSGANRSLAPKLLAAQN